MEQKNTGSWDGVVTQWGGCYLLIVENSNVCALHKINNNI